MREVIFTNQYNDNGDLMVFFVGFVIIPGVLRIQAISAVGGETYEV